MFSGMANKKTGEMIEIKAKVVLSDIEGTTTSYRFVKDVLFPYSKQHMRSYLDQNWNELSAIVRSLVQLPQFKEYLKAHNFASINSEVITRFVNFLIDKDLKLAPIKTLQGLVWEKGFKDGTINGHVYEDVPVAFKRWHEAGILIGIYSSGSVAAQKLLFENTSYGSLLTYIKAHFDTHVGHKQEQESYVNIAKALNVSCKDVLFLTDVSAEAEAASSAGMNAVLVTRPGNPGLTDDQKSQFEIVNDFDSIHVSIK